MKEVRTRFFQLGEDFALENAPGFGPLSLADEVYGQLSPEQDNAFLLEPALFSPHLTYTLEGKW